MGESKRTKGDGRAGAGAVIGVAARLLVGATTTLVFLAGAPSETTASETKQFGITSFLTQTTETSSPGVNEPYMFTQAGGHPSALTSTVQFESTGDPKDIIIDLPPGLVANPQAVARCSPTVAQCPADSQVGVFVLRFTGEKQLAVLGAIVNMTPYAGQAAELGLEVPFLGRVILAGRLVRTAQGYTLAIVGHGLPVLNLGSLLSGAPALHLGSMETTLWGVPAAVVHNPQRGIVCFGLGSGWTCQGGGVSDGEEAVPFLTMPDNCSTRGETTVAWADSWEQPGQFVRAQSTLSAMRHCDRLPFDPVIEVRSETLLAEAPDGINLRILTPELAGSDIVASSELRVATVTLPQGMSINPAVADGLQACSASGPAGINIPTGRNASGEPLEPGEVGEGEELGPGGEPELAPGHCPEESIVGHAEATTPLLPHPIEGRVYIATPGCGAPSQGACTEQDAADGNLYRLYVELGGGANTKRNEGVLIKLAAMVQTNPATGQLTVRLIESPQLPLSGLSLHLFGGERALLANPATCGRATTTSELAPWSAPYIPDASPSSYFDVTGCANAPLDPGFLAGSIDVSAGASTALTATVIRHSGEPYLSVIQVQTPPGISAMLSRVPLCGEPQAALGTCPQASRIGSSAVVAGGGSQPLYMPGNIYLTGGFGGAPFGLSIITNAQAGPLNLGTVVIRARINIDPSTAGLTITTNPLPQIVLGVPLRIQRVSLNVDRPGFIVNPTNCAEQQVIATIAAVNGASAWVSNRFGLADCKSLYFRPKLSASTNAHPSLANGASLDMKLTYPKIDRGAANLARIKIALPRELPSRLATLQKACPQTTFNTNPAACPSASIVGIARAQTPMLPTVLTGPVYFVTRGHDAFPSPIVVLQGDGVRLDLPGSTAIDKAGIAHVAFNTIPDVPIDSLELYLPQGVHSLVSANTNLCGLVQSATIKRKITQRMGGRIVRRIVKVHVRLPPSLEMPTEFVGQNGAVTHQTAKIRVTGCGASRTATQTQNHD